MRRFPGMIRLRALPLLLPALFVFCRPASAQIPRQNPQTPGGDTRETRQYFVRGWVSDAATHSRIEGVRVDLVATTGGTIGTNFTRGNGEFEFDNIGQGSYNLVATYAGYVTANEQLQVFYGSVLGMEVELRRAPDPNSKVVPGPSKISVRQLSIPHKAQDAMKNGLTLLYAKSDYKGSIKQFERAIQEYPDYYEAYAAMGIAYIGLKDKANAEQALRKSIDVSHEQYVEALCVLADLFSNDKRFSDAEPLARKGVELDSDSWQANSELARALVGLDRSADAEPIAAKAVKLAPENAQLRLLLANVHMNEQNYPALLEDLNGYLKLAPTGPFADQARTQRDDIQQHLAAENSSSPEQKTQP
jgi:tetratricopeptide (TPR) repeat protein